MSAPVLVGIAVAVCAVVMTAVWIVSVRVKNAGIVDVAWSALFSAVAAIYAVLGSGAPLRRAVAAGMMIFWSLRLALHLGRRVLGHIDVEDGRYAELRDSWGGRADAKMFWFFQFQGATNVALSIPVLLASVDPSGRIGVTSWIAIALWLVAICGESIADAQLRRFKSDPANRGQVCRSGLWAWSRHPNYFFEWLIWCAFALFALESPHGWIAAICPVLMFWFLYRVTGIPATERQALRSRGDAYRDYQRTTSAFVPWFPRSAGENAHTPSNN